MKFESESVSFFLSNVFYPFRLSISNLRIAFKVNWNLHLHQARIFFFEGFRNQDSILVLFIQYLHLIITFGWMWIVNNINSLSLDFIWDLITIHYSHYPIIFLCIFSNKFSTYLKSIRDTLSHKQWKVLLLPSETFYNNWLYVYVTLNYIFMINAQWIDKTYYECIDRIQSVFRSNLFQY